MISHYKRCLLVFSWIFIVYMTYRHYHEYCTRTSYQSPDMWFPKMEFSDKLLEVSEAEFFFRRNNLFKLLVHDSSKKNNSLDCDLKIVILLANRKYMMTNDVSYGFHQDNDVLYLAGYNKPDAIIVLEENNTQQIVFEDTKIKNEANSSTTIILPLQNVREVLETRYRNKSLCVWRKETKIEEDPVDTKRKSITELLSALDDGKKGRRNNVFDIGYNIHLLRMLKSRREIEIIKEASMKLSKIFLKVMQISTRGGEGVSVSALSLYVEHECKRMGAKFTSFTPVVTNGKSRTIGAHRSMTGNAVFNKTGDWILLDAGCEFDGYSTDMTRTWPLSKVSWSDQYWDIYRVVLNAYKQCLTNCVTGVSLAELNDVALQSLADGLVQLGIISQDLTNRELIKKVEALFPHFIGHFIGLDVHDTPSIHSGIPLQTGMVFTIEPGIYVPLGSDILDKHYEGISIRIEDMVLMTRHGPKVLTSAAPVDIKDLKRHIL